MAVSASLSECGPVRSVNADAVLADDAHGFYAIADGIGSKPTSSAASQLAVREAFRAFNSAQASGAAIDLAAVIEATAAHFRAHFAGEALVPGTTLTLLVVTPTEVHYASVGDSPLLLLHADGAALLTKHHTAVDQSHIITNFSALKSHSGSNVLVNTVGRLAPRPVTYPPMAIVGPCRMLLATDGLFEIVSQDELGALSAAAPDAAALASTLEARAARRRAPDNFSAVIVDLERGEDGHAERL